MSSLANSSAIYTAVVTPFRDGRLDEGAFVKICTNQIEAGTGIVVGSDIGEGLALDESEVLRLLHIASSLACQRVPVLCYLDTALNGNEDLLGRLLIRAGASSIICRFPRSTTFSESDGYACLRRISHTIDRPVFFEHKAIGGRQIISEEKVVALYDAGLIEGLILSDLDPMSVAARRKALGDEFIQLIDDDRLAACHIASGGHGWITAAGNIAPKACSQLVSTWNGGDMAKFRSVRDMLSVASGALNTTHPSISLKAALKQYGMLDGTVRHPLHCLDNDTETKLVKALSGLQSLDRMARRGHD